MTVVIETKKTGSDSISREIVSSTEENGSMTTVFETVLEEKIAENEEHGSFPEEKWSAPDEDHRVTKEKEEEQEEKEREQEEIVRMIEEIEKETEENDTETEEDDTETDENDEGVGDKTSLTPCVMLLVRDGHLRTERGAPHALLHDGRAVAVEALQALAVAAVGLSGAKRLRGALRPRTMVARVRGHP